MVIYRVTGAYLAEDAEHRHVSGLQVRKWRAKKKSYGRRKDFSRDKVIEKIEEGAVFRLKSRDKKTTGTIIFEKCGTNSCTEIVLRTMADHEVTDDLDYLYRP